MFTTITKVVNEITLMNKGNKRVNKIEKSKKNTYPLKI